MRYPRGSEADIDHTITMVCHIHVIIGTVSIIILQLGNKYR